MLTPRRVRSSGRRSPARPVLAAAGACALALAGFALGAQTDVTLTAEGPQPRTVTVNWGDTVAFKNTDSAAHGVLIPAATVTSPDIPSGGSFTQVFDKKKGAYTFVQTGERRRTGLVQVQVRGELEIAASRERVTFGQSVTLNGTSPYPNSPVVISLRRTGGTTETELVTVPAGETGAFTASFPPEYSSQVRAAVAAGQLRSARVTVRVVPRLSIGARPRTQRAGRYVSVTARIAPAAAAESVQLRRYDPRRELWVRVETKPVTKTGAAAFRWKVEKGRTLLRIEVARSDLARSYEPTFSSWVAVKGTAPPPKR